MVPTSPNQSLSHRQESHFCLTASRLHGVALISEAENGSTVPLMPWPSREKRSERHKGLCFSAIAPPGDPSPVHTQSLRFHPSEAQRTDGVGQGSASCVCCQHIHRYTPKNTLCDWPMMFLWTGSGFNRCIVFGQPQRSCPKWYAYRERGTDTLCYLLHGLAGMEEWE